MRFITFLMLTWLYISPCHAQVTTGITGKKDTSFNNYTAFLSARKQYPDIKMVNYVPSAEVKERRDITYCNSANGPLHLDVLSPKKVKNAPAVLIIHGGGWRTGDRSQHLPLAVELAKAGYVAITVEYRLSTIALYPAAVNDVKAAIKWTKANAKSYGIDRDKIAILGFSAGGELAAFAGATGDMQEFEGTGGDTAENSTVKAVIDIDGILSFIHPESAEGDDSRSISAATYWFGYGKKEKPELWESASSLTYAAKSRVPILFLNSSADRMHAGRDDMIKILNQNNVYTEVHAFAGSPHTFCLFEPWFTPTVKYTVDFLHKIFK
ncbi:MAG: alpha/beta hydrolase [Bacteroidota bacterium]